MMKRGSEGGGEDKRERKEYILDGKPLFMKGFDTIKITRCDGTNDDV